MKKWIIFMTLIMLSACQSTSNQTPTSQNVYKDGTYTTSAIGYGGSFEVETIIKDDKIEDIIVKDNNETPSIGGVAIEQMISQMKKENKADVDTISGATKTSQALKEAVKKALDDAKIQSK